ncbi:hypothetical protein BEP19_07985 [Ammoniphilus oxalaticus]|uniref:Uncharacterized protein n=1 Tax=Ammoniphilus oxalaticus TaxID=66863 RepID=A0A419SK98_9BACL|nr:hypothetical protein [Ammoniphilus oxalaticus]RKD24328.1 hypothetical protein BEP19_07985 [Ammoniphilus oxalaticus]
MRLGTFFNLLLGAALLAVAIGGFLPALLDVFGVDEQQEQKMAESVVEEAAWWYVLHQGQPLETMQTEQVKEALIPDYLNKWPGKYPIQCEIDSNGNINVKTIKHNTTWKERIRHLFAGEITLR